MSDLAERVAREKGWEQDVSGMIFRVGHSSEPPDLELALDWVEAAGIELEVMRSAAGFFFGTRDPEDGSALSRETGYWPSREAIERARDEEQTRTVLSWEWRGGMNSIFPDAAAFARAIDRMFENNALAETNALISRVSAVAALPARELEKLWHVGEMKGVSSERRSSLEGDCLSVSQCPRAWSAIAKLGGGQAFLLQRANARFVDVHAALRNTELVEKVRAWAANSGYVVRTEAFKAWFPYEEGEDWRFFVCGTDQEARDEAAECEGGLRPDGGPVVEPFEFYAPTPALAGKMKCTPASLKGCEVDDLLLGLWVRSHSSSFDGLFWDDAFDPVGLSAPRLGIFPECLPQWQISEIPFSALPEDEVGSLDPDGPCCE